MSSSNLLLPSAGLLGAVKTAVDDVFSSYLYVGDQASRTIANGINLQDFGGMVWTKDRSVTSNNTLRDTLPIDGIGSGNLAVYKNTEDTGAGVNGGSPTDWVGLVNGYTISGNDGVNRLNSNFVSWTFRVASKFFAVVRYTGNGAANRQISHGLGVSPGFIQAFNSLTHVLCFHRSATGDFVLGTNAGQTGSKAIINAATASNFTVSGAANTNGISYTAYLWAHDSDQSEGKVQCGSFTVDSIGAATVNLGWEPQFLLIKSLGIGNWQIFDTTRGFGTAVGFDAALFPDSTNQEVVYDDEVNVIPQGFSAISLVPDNTYVYVAIRRPDKIPTTGAEVFSANAHTSTAGTKITTGFAPDMQMFSLRGGDLVNAAVISRLLGVSTTPAAGNTNYNSTSNIDAEATGLASRGWDNTGYQVTGASSTVTWNFRRVHGFFEEVAFTGSGSPQVVPHGLRAVPELLIVKQRSAAGAWLVYAAPLGANSRLSLNSTALPAADTTAWNNTTPTSTGFTVGTRGDVNDVGQTYIARMFATLAGVSKVGSYTGNGASLTVDCGFTTGARFILIKRTSGAVGGWHVFDTARGIVTGNDPYLTLESAAAEVATNDSVDPTNVGFVVNQVTATNLNVSGSTYLFLAIS